MGELFDELLSQKRAIEGRETIIIDIGPHLRHLIKRLFPKQQSQPTVTGGDIMFVLPDDQPDVPFTISAIDVSGAKDAEGNPITVLVAELLKSDNPAAVDFIFDAGSSATNPRSGKLHIGGPGIATLNYAATD